MDAVLLAGCGALTWAGAFVATGMAGATRPGGSRRVQRALRSRLLASLVDSGVPGVGLLVTALSISQRTGSPLRELFQRSANLVESHRQMERELVVKTAQVRLSARVVCLLPLALVGILSLISPDFQEGAATPLGMGCLLVALAMDGAALVIMRRLMKEVL